MAKSQMWEHIRQVVAQLPQLPYIRGQTYGIYTYSEKSDIFTITKSGLSSSIFSTRVQYVAKFKETVRIRYITELRTTIPFHIFTVKRHYIIHRHMHESGFPQVEQRWGRDGRLLHILVWKDRDAIAWSSTDLQDLRSSEASDTLADELREHIAAKSEAIYNTPLRWQIDYERELVKLLDLSELNRFIASVQEQL